jgi:uncharacterized protein (DUF885 family)
LVLSVDTSSSVEDWELQLQKRGLAEALRDRDVQSAMLGSGPIKISVLFWGDSAAGSWTSGWHLVATPADADRLAQHITRMPAAIGGNTDLGAGSGAALALLSRPEACAARKIVNITGDGRETLVPRRRSELSLAAARRQAAQMGVIINGLAIENEDPELANYYRGNLIVGPNAFVMSVKELSDYTRAIRRKIARETSTIVSELP